MRHKYTFIFIGIILIVIALILSVKILRTNFIFLFLIGIAGLLFIFFTLFEKSKVSTEKIVIIALLSSLASVGRILFSSIPSVQASSFVIIVTGMVFGGEVGFMTGAGCAIVSNLLLGQGPWTIWQVFCWGMMGLLSGILSKVLHKSQIFRLAYGLVCGILFGWIMNLWHLSVYPELTKEIVFFSYLSSFPMDLAHGLSNAVLLYFIGARFIKILDRIAIKYGLTTTQKN